MPRQYHHRSMVTAISNANTANTVSSHAVGRTLGVSVAGVKVPKIAS